MAARAWWTAVVALPFVLLPRQSPGGMGVLWYLRDNAYVDSTLVLIVLVGPMLWSRSRPITLQESEPDPIDHSIEAPTDQVAATRTVGSAGDRWRGLVEFHGYR
jgi:hypothetical protein